MDEPILEEPVTPTYRLVMRDGTVHGPDPDLLKIFALARTLNERAERPPVTKEIVRSDGVVLATYGITPATIRGLLKIFENDQEVHEDEIPLESLEGDSD